MVEKLFPDSFLKSQNWVYLRINSLKFYEVCFYCILNLRALETKWNQASDHLSIPCIKLFQKNKKRSGTSLPASFLRDFSMIFEEKYFSCHILLTDQISLSCCFNSWDIEQYVLNIIVCLSCCDVIYFEINLMYLIEPIFLHDQIVKTKV